MRATDLLDSGNDRDSQSGQWASRASDVRSRTSMRSDRTKPDQQIYRPGRHLRAGHAIGAPYGRSSASQSRPLRALQPAHRSVCPGSEGSSHADITSSILVRRLRDVESPAGTRPSHAGSPVADRDAREAVARAFEPLVSQSGVSTYRKAIGFAGTESRFSTPRGAAR